MTAPVLTHNTEDLAAAIAAGHCRDCLGAGELEVNHVQNMWGTWECDYVACPECHGTGTAPVYDDGLTDEQYEQLRRLETGVTVCALPSCPRETTNATGYCDSCTRDARADHESQQAS